MRSVAVGSPCSPVMFMIQCRYNLITTFCANLCSILCGSRSRYMSYNSIRCSTARGLAYMCMTVRTLISPWRNIEIMWCEITIFSTTDRADCLALAGSCTAGAVCCFRVAGIRQADPGMRSVAVGSPCSPIVGVCRPFYFFICCVKVSYKICVIAVENVFCIKWRYAWINSCQSLILRRSIFHININFCVTV